MNPGLSYEDPRSGELVYCSTEEDLAGITMYKMPSPATGQRLWVDILRLGVNYDRIDNRRMWNIWRPLRTELSKHRKLGYSYNVSGGYYLTAGCYFVFANLADEIQMLETVIGASEESILEVRDSSRNFKDDLGGVHSYFECPFFPFMEEATKNLFRVVEEEDILIRMQERVGVLWATALRESRPRSSLTLLKPGYHVKETFGSGLQKWQLGGTGSSASNLSPDTGADTDINVLD
jgi:hypothetical protein